MAKTAEVYDGSSIEVLKGLEPVRRRPGMYTDTQSPNHLALEVVDNSVDEAMAGYATHIEVILHEDESLEIVDNGRGMPVDLHPEEQVPAIELILSRLHAGGKFSDKSYTYAGGLHGVGVSVVNALSEKLTATVRRGGRVYTIGYAQGQKVSSLQEVGRCAVNDTGTAVRFWPEAPYFDNPHFVLSALKYQLRAKALLCPNLTISFESRLRPEDNESWVYQGDLKQYALNFYQMGAIAPAEPYHESLKEQDWQVEWAVCWEKEEYTGAHLSESYVNLIPTIEGGTHVNGLRQGLTAALREFCEIHSLLPRALKIAPDDVWSRCGYVLSLKMHDPQFAGQTKEKLSSRQIASPLEILVRDRFSLWLNTHVEEGKEIASLVIESARNREAQARVVTRKKVVRGPQLPGKLVDCTSGDPKLGELFIVEGDSAGGSARQARDSAYQAILPLRGKILNTWEVSADKALQSEEIRAISVAMGIEPDSESLAGLRYNKICILADADSDGLHIGTLLCALFVRHFAPLVREGHVYVACPPLYRIDCGKLKEYALDDEELKVKQSLLIKKGHKKDSIQIQRFKGLGEMNPAQLRETTLAPQSRRLMQLQLTEEEGEETYALMDMLLSKKRAADRRQWLENNGDKAELLV